MTINSEPTFSLLFAVMYPLWLLTILRQIASPIPVPSYSVRPCSRWKMLKIFSVNFSLNPIPLSLTIMTVYLVSGSVRPNSRLISWYRMNIPVTSTIGGSFSLWNFMALLIKFWNNRFICIFSPTTEGIFSIFSWCKNKFRNWLYKCLSSRFKLWRD